MIGIDEAVHRLSAGVEAVRQHVPREYWPDPRIAAAIAIVAGVVLLLWGGRLLRALYVVAFMGLGAAVGVKLARSAGTDDLIGLVLGGGVVGLVGHLLYRWWVGVTAGVVAVLLVAMVGGIRYWPEIQAEIQTGTQAFDDQTHGVGTGVYTLPRAAQGENASVRAYLGGLAAYYWETRRDRAYRVGFVLTLAWLAGVGMGLTLPRFTTILGTSMVGVLSLAVGLSVLISTYWPGLWGVVVGHVAWFLGGLVVVLLISLSHQVRRGRGIPLPPPAPNRVASPVPAT